MNIRTTKGCIHWLAVITMLSCAMYAQAANKDFVVAPNGGDISGAALSAQLAQGNVTLQSSQGANSGSGNLIINDIVTWSANSTLTLVASNNVIINTNISASGSTAGLVISPATANGGESPNSTGVYGLNGAAITLSGNTPSLIIAGSPYVVINSLGAATDAKTPPASPTLQGMAATVNLANNFALGNDIDATVTSTWNSGAGFTLIGERGDDPLAPPPNPFTGRFDGLGHTIGKLTIQLPSKKLGVGLYGVTGNGSVVRNVRLVDATVAGNHRVGGLVGENNGVVNQCSAKSIVTGVNNTACLVGYNTASGVVSNSYSAGAVSTSKGGLNVGALVGANSGVIRNCYATGSVSGNGNNVGGLVGSNGDVLNTGPRQILNCYATGVVAGSSAIGGLVGANSGGTTNNSYWNTGTSGKTASAGGTGLTTAQMRTKASFTGFDFPGTWIIVEGMTFPLLAFENSTTIYNPFQLQLMAANLSANYTLGADIDASATRTGTSIWGSSGFAPIGNAITPFTGNLDGNGHTISSLMINMQNSDNVGLFGYTSANAAINNVGMSNSAVTGRNSVGALAGYNGGNISNCYAESANITGTDSTTSSGSGGLVGTNGGTIGSCHTTGSVTGIDDVGGLVGVNSGQVTGSNSLATVANATGQAGGLVGTNEQGGSISASYASGVVGDVGISGEMGGLVGLNSGSISYSNALGRVDCGDNSSGGGLVGNNGGTISNSYATGGVSGTGTSVGALVGINAQGATIATTYATGSVVGQTNVGGLVGNNNGTISNGYWNSSLNQTGIGAGTNTGATGLTATQMLVSSNFSNFTITTKPGTQGWVVVNTDGSLQTSASTATAATSPLLATEYSTVIDNAHQLQLMLMNLGADYSLISDLDASGTGNGREVWGPLGFVPIRIGNTNRPFTGIFDGQQHSIRRLTINRWDDNVGLFGYTNNATIRNVGLTSSRISGNNNVGALVGYNNNSTVSTSFANAHVSGVTNPDKDGFGDAIGGLVGYNRGNIDHSYAEGISYGLTRIGGLVGNNSGTINSSAARTNVNARAALTGANSGGLVGYNSGQISNSYTSGNVISKKGLGGLVGTNSNGTISTSYARTGLLSSPSTKDIGGLAGINSGTINNSYWDTTTSGQPGSAGGTGLTDSQMMQQTSFSGWDFTDIWEMQTYPALRNMPAGYTP